MPLTKVNGQMLDGAITANATGDVGIGTTSPSCRLDVNRGSAGLLANFTDGVNTNFQIGTTSFLATIGPSAGSTSMAFKTGDTERMRIDNAGVVIVGKNNTGFDNTGMYINAVGQTISTMTNNADSGGANFYMNRRGVNGTVCLFYKDSVSVGSISVTGSATSYVTSSDYRLKENITPMTGALNTVAQLKPCTYNWKTDGSVGQGFIAHELATVCPDAVSGEKDAVDEEGNIKPQGIDTSFLVATLTAAIQELNAKVDAQAAEIAALKAQP